MISIWLKMEVIAQGLISMRSSVTDATLQEMSRVSEGGVRGSGGMESWEGGREGWEERRLKFVILASLKKALSWSF